MENPEFTKELYLMIANYLRDKNPEVYQMMSHYFADNMASPELGSLDETLSVRYGNLPPDHFLDFLKTLRPGGGSNRQIPLFGTDIAANLVFLGHNYSHMHPIYNLCVDPHSRFFITGSDDQTMKLYTLPDFHERFTFTGHTDVIANIAIHPDVSYLLSSSHDQTVRLWSLKTGDCVSILGGFTGDDIHYATFSPDGSKIVCGSEDGGVFLWRTEDVIQGKNMKTEITPSEYRGAVVWACFSPGSEFIVFPVEPSRVVVTCPVTRQYYWLNFHSTNVTYVAFSKRLYPSRYGMAPMILTVAFEEGSVALWTLEEEGFVAHSIVKPKSQKKALPVSSVCWDLDDNLIVILRGNDVLVADSASREIIAALPEITSCHHVAQNPAQREYFALVSTKGSVSVWNLHELRFVCSWTPDEPHDFLECVWSPDGRFIIVSDADGRVVMLGFSADGSMFTACDKQETMNIDFEIKCDLSYQNECSERERDLAIRIANLGQRTFDAPDPIPAIEAPQELAHIVTKRARNPLVVTPSDDYERLWLQDERLSEIPIDEHFLEADIQRRQRQ